MDDMRRDATAHLGKVERELRPTVIVTESDTVLLGNSEKESRRIKRVPKKFEDYQNQMIRSVSDSELDEPPAKKFRGIVEIDESFKARVRGNKSLQEHTDIKNEVKKMLHVNVGLYRLKLRDVACFCLIHNLYKCYCKNEVVKETTDDRPNLKRPLPDNNAELSVPIKTLNFNHMRRNSFNYASYLSAKKEKQEANATTLEAEVTTPEPDEEEMDDGFSRRVLPFSFTKHKPKVSTTATLNSSDGIPKIEIQNLCDLINGGFGPIFINVYDDKTMRLNQVLRSVLNNKCAIVFANDRAFFVDKERVNLKALDYGMFREEGPIFIIQGKDNFPGPISSTMTDEFVKVMFKQDSEKIIRIHDKNSFSEIAEIIESILRNVRKKIETKIGQDQSELVKEQLSMLTRERSQSTSTRSHSTSLSSTNSSPLSFKGLRLQEAPPPGRNTPAMQEFNKIFSVRMQKLVDLVSSNTLGLHPSNEMLNKFYIYQWSFLLRSFEEGLVEIWQVKLEGESGEGYQLMVLTDSTVTPNVEQANKENIINIRMLSLSDKITELTRMILLRVENMSLKNMTILMYGCRGYLRVCGILNSKEQYLDGFVAKPSRSTHPRIAAKIQKAYHIWHESKKKIKINNDMKLRKQQVEKTEENELELNRKLGASSLIQLKSLGAMNCRAGRKKAELTAAPCSNSENLTLLKGVVLHSRHPEFDIPISTTPANASHSDFKWFLFNITNDFSDIFIKSWSRYLSFKVIMDAVTRAKAQGRAVALTPSNKNVRKWPRIYALPAAPLKFKEQESMTSNFLIFGPYMRNSNSNLLLMQNVDGVLILRDEYEKRNNITRATRTRCLWIYANTLKCIQDADPIPLKLMWGTPGEALTSKTTRTQEDICDD